MGKKKRVRPRGALDDGLIGGGDFAPAMPPKSKKPSVAKSNGKKTSKKAAAAAQFSTIEDSRKSVSKWLETAAVDMGAKHGGMLNVHLADKEHAMVIGVPFPCLALEYLYNNNVMPLGGRITQIVGSPGSCKSGLAIEHGRWFIDRGGVTLYREHESKYSPDWAPSIIGWDRQKSFLIHNCHSIDEWQQSLLDWSKKIQEMMVGELPKNPGPGAVYPVLNIVDSIMGKSMDETQNRIINAGHAGRDHPVEASSITKYMRTYPQQVASWPFHLILINHLRISKDPDTQARVRDKPGGWAKDFQETFEVESTKIEEIHLANCDGIRLNLRTYKNSLGTGSRQIEVPVRWSEEDDPENPDGYRQVTVWDWDESTLTLLAERLPEVKRNKVKEIINLTLNKTARTVSSPRLGVKKDSPISYEEAHAAIKADAALVHELRRVLGVKIHNVFETGTDFRQQILQSKEAAAVAYKRDRDKDAARKKKKSRFR